MAADRFQARDLGDGLFGRIGPPHFFQNIGEKDVLAGRIGLAGDSAFLSAAGVVEAMLPQPNARDQVERLHFMEVEPTGVAQDLHGVLGVPGFGVEAAEGKPCAVLPPMVAREIGE